MYAIEFNAEIKDRYIKIPDNENFDFQRVRVVLIAEPDAVNKKSENKSALGILHKYANPDLQHLEKNAFADAMGEKHATP